MTWIKPEDRAKGQRVLDKFWKEKGAKNYKVVRNGGPCHWCTEFKPLGFRVCMNCGCVFDET